MSAPSLPTPALVVIYCRVSDPGQSTVPEQEKWARLLAEQNGWIVAAVVVDEGLSGDDCDRPGLRRLGAVFAEQKRRGRTVDRLIVWHTNRLSRSDTLDAFRVLADLRDQGLRYVVTHDRSIDLRNRMDRSLWSLEQDHANNQFLPGLAAGVLSGMAKTAAAGFWIGRVPLGYRLERTRNEHGEGKRRRSGKLAVDEETAAIVRELFERYDVGASTTTLAVWLSARVRPPQACGWSAQTVRQILRNTVYVGIRRFGARSRGKHARLQGVDSVPQDEDKGEDNIAAALVLRDVPAIVDPALFARVQARLDSGRRRGHRKDAQPMPLTGLGRCGSCGGVLHAVNAHVRHRSGKRTRTRRLICAARHRYGKAACPHGSTGAPHDRVLDAILAEIADRLLAGGAAERLALMAEEQAVGAERRLEAERAALQRQLHEIDTALSRSQDRLLRMPDDLIEDCQAAIRRLKQQRIDLAAQLENTRKESARPDFDPARFRAFWEACQRARDLAKEGPSRSAALRPLLAELIDGFTLHFGVDKRGRSTPARVDVLLPEWLSALAGKDCIPIKLCVTVLL